MMNDRQQRVANQVGELIDNFPLVLDTETTGLGHMDELVDIAIIDLNGMVLLDTLIKPLKLIPAEATRIHHISNVDVAGAPTLIDILPQLETIFRNRVIAIYNAEYDLRIIYQSLQVHRLEKSSFGTMIYDMLMARRNVACIMKLYSEFYGNWNDYRRNYTWQSLENACKQCNIFVPRNQLHRAKIDAELSRQVILHMAGISIYDDDRYDYETRELPVFDDETIKIQTAFDDANAAAYYDRF